MQYPWTSPCTCLASRPSSRGCQLPVQVVGQRIPISKVQLRLQDDNWHDMQVSGDGYWQPVQGLPFAQDPQAPVGVRVFCSDGSPPKVDSVIPARMLCGYQDPQCQTVEGSIQC